GGRRPEAHRSGGHSRPLLRGGLRSGKGGRMSAGATATSEDLRRFLANVFAPGDEVLIRPIEVWEEVVNGKKERKSRVLYKKTRHLTPERLLDPDVWGKLLALAAAERANLFFGVCPRFRGSDQYDFAWQIRTVRVLWADLDNCTPAEALARCEAAGLPRPSV